MLSTKRQGVQNRAPQHPVFQGCPGGSPAGCRAGGPFSASVLTHSVPSSRNLSNNKIKEVREGAFDGAAGVQELMLTGNQLETVHGRMFRGLSGLKTL